MAPAVQLGVHCWSAVQNEPIRYRVAAIHTRWSASKKSSYGRCTE